MFHMDMTILLILPVIALASAQTLQISDETLQLWNEYPSLINQTNHTAPITRQSHPIINPNQFSHWTLGLLYKLPMDAHNCSYDTSPTSVIPVTIQTSHLLGPKAEGFECWAVRHYEEKTLYFFGNKFREYTETPIPINSTQCTWIVAQMTDFTGQPLQQIRWDYYATTRKTYTYYHWPITITSTVTNYHVRKVNVTVSIDDFSTIEVLNTNFQNPCSFSQTSCVTGSRKGTVIWGSGLTFAGKSLCQNRKYQTQSCLLSQQSLRCIEANIVIASLFEPYRCGRRSAFVRMVLTNNSYDPLLINSTDFVPSTADFNNIYDEVQHFHQNDLQLIATQFDICGNPNN